ncbi:hypothetical protein MFM001_05240 [Mycobacterium sp. MFM001]|nr:hypothetical protein MFM001_05240 [Mycobacterium sp. MFM001]
MRQGCLGRRGPQTVPQKIVAIAHELPSSIRQLQAWNQYQSPASVKSPGAAAPTLCKLAVGAARRWVSAVETPEQPPRQQHCHELLVSFVTGRPAACDLAG